MQAAGGPRGGFLLKALPCSSWGAGAGWGQPRTDFPVPRACGATRQRPPGLRLLLSFAFGAPVCTHSVPTAGLASNSRSETYLPLLRPGITGAEKCDGQTPSEGDDRDRRTRVTEGLRIAPLNGRCCASLPRRLIKATARSAPSQRRRALRPGA